MADARRVGPGGTAMLILDEDDQDGDGKPAEVQSQSDLANVGLASVEVEDRKAKSDNLGEVDLAASKEREEIEVEVESPEPDGSPTLPDANGSAGKGEPGFLAEFEDTEELKKERFVKKKPPNPKNMELDVFDDHNIYSLHDLTKCGFEMPTSDKDFTLTHETLIKAVKILLYKVNIQQRKL